MFSRTQLDHPGLTRSEETFHEKTGLKPEDLAGKTVLEAGCGMGRFLDIVSRNPHTKVIGFDLSLAVDAAFNNIGERSNVDIVQGDIMRPPFRVGSFDLIYSIGVLHHTPNPRKGFRALVPLIREDGQIAIWVYARYRRPPVSDLYRKFTTRMPYTMVLAISRLLAALFSLSRNFQYLTVLLPMSDAADFEARVLDNFDWYSPKYQFKFDAQEILSWFSEMNLENITPLKNPISIRGTSRAPAPVED